MIRQPLFVVLMQHLVGVAYAFRSQPQIGFAAGLRLESYKHKSRRRTLQQQYHTTFYAKLSYKGDALLSATESSDSSSSSPLDGMLEKFAMPLEFKKGGDVFNKKDATAGDNNAVAPSSDGGDAAVNEVESSSSTADATMSSTEKTTDAASFTPSADTPLANKYYLKKKQMAEEAQQTETPSVEEKTSPSVPAPAPPRRRFADFGIASEASEPINGEGTVQDTIAPSDDSTTATTKLRGFTDFSMPMQQSRIKVNIEGNEKAPETKPLRSGNDAKPQNAADNVQETTSPTAPTIKEEKVGPTATLDVKEEKTPAAASSASAIKEESTTTPSPAATTSSQPSSSELIETQPVSPTNTLTLPNLNNLDIEDFGLLPLIIIGISVYLALGMYLKQVNKNDDGYAGWDELRKENGNGGEKKEEEQQGIIEKTKELLQKVKDAGTAGAISYALWEAAFWGVSIPVCLVSYRQVTGTWPDFTSGEDVRKVGLEAFAFVNFARLAVPIRIGLALSTVPWVEENVLTRFGGGFRANDTGDDVDEVTSSERVMMIDENAQSSGFSDYGEEQVQYGDNFQQQPPQLDSSAYYNEQDFEDADDTSALSNVMDRLNRMENEASRLSSTALESIDVRIDPSMLEYCEPGEVNDDCSEEIAGYLDGLASTGAVATDGEVKAIVGYLGSLSTNVGTPNENTGAAFTSYLDALSTGYIPPPSSARAVASYLDVLSNESSSSSLTTNTAAGKGDAPYIKEVTNGSRINEVEERLIRLETDIASLPDDIASRLVDWQISQDKKLSDEMEKIMQLLVDGRSLEK